MMADKMFMKILGEIRKIGRNSQKFRTTFHLSKIFIENKNFLEKITGK